MKAFAEGWGIANFVGTILCLIGALFSAIPSPNFHQNFEHAFWLLVIAIYGFATASISFSRASFGK